MISQKTVIICDFCGYEQENYRFDIPMSHEPKFFQIKVDFRDGFVGYSGHLCSKCFKKNDILNKLYLQVDRKLKYQHSGRMQ